MNSLLRKISATAVADAILTDEFYAGSAQNDLAEAERNYLKWRDAQAWSRDEEENAFEAIVGYLSATEFYYHEQGMRYGIQLMCEVMTDNTISKALDRLGRQTSALSTHTAYEPIMDYPDTEFEKIDMASEAVALFEQLTPAHQD